MINTRSELLESARKGEWDALKHLYLVRTRYDYDEEVDAQAYLWYESGIDPSLKDVFRDLVDMFSDEDSEDYLCTEESAYCVMRYLGDDRSKYSLYDFAEEILAKYLEHKKKEEEK